MVLISISVTFAPKIHLYKEIKSKIIAWFEPETHRLLAYYPLTDLAIVLGKLSNFIQIKIISYFHSLF